MSRSTAAGRGGKKKTCCGGRCRLQEKRQKLGENFPNGAVGLELTSMLLVVLLALLQVARSNDERLEGSLLRNALGGNGMEQSPPNSQKTYLV